MLTQIAPGRSQLGSFARLRTFVVHRVGHLLVVVVGISVIVFLFLHLSGDPARLLAAQDATDAEVERLRRSLGLADPLYVQYLRFAWRALHADFGDSFRYNTPALGLVLDRMPATLELAASSLALAVATAVPLGIVPALRRNSVRDVAVRTLALVGQSIPTFWLGLMLVLVVSVQLKLLPTSGRGDAAHLVLPCVTLACFFIARIARMTRSGMLDVLGQDYVRTARAKGLAERRVVVVHALKNASIPLVTLIGLDLGSLLGGAVVTETIFAWPGVGRLAVQAIYSRDFPVVQAAVFVLAAGFVVVNMAVDLLYAYLDPRIRFE